MFQARTSGFPTAFKRRSCSGCDTRTCAALAATVVGGDLGVPSRPVVMTPCRCRRTRRRSRPGPRRNRACCTRGRSGVGSGRLRRGSLIGHPDRPPRRQAQPRPALADRLRPAGEGPGPFRTRRKPGVFDQGRGAGEPSRSPVSARDRRSPDRRPNDRGASPASGRATTARRAGREVAFRLTRRRLAHASRPGLRSRS